MRPNHRYTMRSKFTTKLWKRWLDRLNGPDDHDPQYRYLAEGIRDFRARCASKEKFPF